MAPGVALQIDGEPYPLRAAVNTSKRECAVVTIRRHPHRQALVLTPRALPRSTNTSQLVSVLDWAQVHGVVSEDQRCAMVRELLRRKGGGRGSPRELQSETGTRKRRISTRELQEPGRQEKRTR